MREKISQQNWVTHAAKKSFWNIRKSNKVCLKYLIQYLFDEIRELSYPPLDSNISTTFKAQKGKDIDKIVHVTWVVRNFMKLQEYFLYTKKLNNWHWREYIVE